MVVIDVIAPDGTIERHVCTTPVVTIGSREDCQIQIAGADPVHVQIAVRDGVVHIEPFGLVRIGDVPIRNGWMRFEDRYAIADRRIVRVDVSPRRFEASYGPIDAAEAALVDAIIDGDAASRMVYADWLDERGDPRAEIVRTLEGGIAPSEAQLARLVPTNVRWRARVLQPVIEGCARGEECPGHWGAVARTGRADLRTCGRCQKLVLYCVDAPQAREHIELGGVIVLDPLSLRWPGDLAVK